jgi:tRNA (guanine-N7-)-methyltransferase
MRLRRKPWARPELAACPFFVDAPQEVRGSWASQFPRKAPIYLELGCGKGGFLAHEAAAHPEVNFIAIDLKSEVLALAKRKVEAALSAAGRPAAQVDNVLLMSWDIERLHLIFGEEERVDRVYVNFCNPWPKPGDHKHRLTHTRQLMSYRRWMGEEAELWFKTDDSGLFRDTLEQYLPQAGYRVEYLTWDLHREALPDNVPTEHEEMFAAQGIPIKFLRAKPERGEAAPC